MTANTHTMYAHGHLYLEFAQHTVGVPLGVLPESAVEAYNKVFLKNAPELIFSPVFHWIS